MNQEQQLWLRPFVPRDYDEVTSWFTDAGQLRFFAGPRLRWPLDAPQWDALRADPALATWTAVFEDVLTPVGHGELFEESHSVVRLARIAVAPDIRGRGIGRTLVTALVQKARDNEYEIAGLHVHKDNATAIRGYRSVGFVSVGPAVDRVDTIRMELNLRGDNWNI
jgi:ribosomal protein S18 acetylase RimI-like enzyme